MSTSTHVPNVPQIADDSADPGLREVIERAKVTKSPPQCPWAEYRGVPSRCCVQSRSTRFGPRLVGGSKSVGGSQSPDQRGFAAFGSDYRWRLGPAGLQRPDGTEDARGFKTAYAENIGLAQMDQVARGYSDDGFDLIIGHGVEFSSALLEVAPDYPRQHYFVTTFLPQPDVPRNIMFVNMGYFAPLMARAFGGADFGKEAGRRLHRRRRRSESEANEKSLCRRSAANGSGNSGPRDYHRRL
jgi:hypothetical protein